MTNLALNRARRDQPYVTRSARAIAARIMAALDDPMSPVPTGPMPFMTRRASGTFDRIMGACMPSPAPTKSTDVRSSSALPPPPRIRRKR